METIEYKGYKINIKYDDNASSPRDDDNRGKMICFHKRYNLGDKHDYRHEDYGSWEEMKRAIVREENAAVILPLYMYDHSGITMKTTPFNCRWDSGQVGFIIMTRKTLNEEYPTWSKEWKNEHYKGKGKLQIAEAILRGEVETYDLFISGECYGYEIEDEEGNDLDSCWGFLGSNHRDSGLLEYAENAIDCHIKYETEDAVED
jgi:hypothetical protein